MLLYSSHDVSLNMALGFLSYNVTLMPGYGASLHFHLYLDEKSGYIVKVKLFKLFFSFSIEINITNTNCQFYISTSINSYNT